jgi:hypothetical protein
MYEEKRCRTVIVLVVCVIVSTGGNVWQYLQRTRQAGIADARYAEAERDFTRQYEKLRDELGRERAIARRERSLNREARGIVSGLKAGLGANTGSVQEAVRVISGMREAVKELEALYSDRVAGGGGD